MNSYKSIISKGIIYNETIGDFKNSIGHWSHNSSYQLVQFYRENIPIIWSWLAGLRMYCSRIRKGTTGCTFTDLKGVLIRNVSSIDWNNGFFLTFEESNYWTVLPS